MLRIGMIGAGWVTEHHLKAYRHLDSRARVVAIADPLSEARTRRAEAFGIPATYADAAEMLAREELDAVDVASPRDTHVAVCRLAATKGVAILCQKPLAPNLREAQALVQNLPDGVRLMVHENWRFRPHYRTIAQWLSEGRVGKVRRASMAIMTSGLLPDAQGKLPAVARQPFFAALDRFLLMEVMIHHVDTLRFLLGRLRLHSACLGHSCSGVRGEDRATLAMLSSGGAAVILDGDFMAHGYPAAQFDRLDIWGDAGAIRLVDTTLQLIGANPLTVRLDLDANYLAAYRGAIGHFVDCLETGAPFETSPADNLETLEIVEAAYAGSSIG